MKVSELNWKQRFSKLVGTVGGFISIFRYDTMLFFHQIQQCVFRLQGRAGEKGQKGELGSSGFDVFSAVKVSSYVI